MNNFIYHHITIEPFKPKVKYNKNEPFLNYQKEEPTLLKDLEIQL